MLASAFPGFIMNTVVGISSISSKELRKTHGDGRLPLP